MPMPRASLSHSVAALIALVPLLAWDASGLDRAVAHWAGGTNGFAWRDHWLLAGLLHEGARRAAQVAALAVCLGVWWPWGPLRGLSATARLQLAVSILLSAAVVSLAKQSSGTSCPWDLREFGGIAAYASHWSFQADGGPGRCFPAGHAASGFSFVGGYFVFASSAPALARRWLAAALGLGLLLGLVQQWRGAHFMSHTLWSAWLCWAVAAALHLAWPARTGVPR